jgi:uncharacterized protein
MLMTETRPPFPPFEIETALQKVQAAEDAWNTRDPAKVALAYTPNSVWRNRDTFVTGREQIIEFLTRKSKKEQGYAPPQRALGFPRQPYGRPVQYEWHDTSGQWSRSYGNKLWEFTPEGLMSRREASITITRSPPTNPASTDPAPKPSTGSTSYLVTTMTTVTAARSA